MYNGGQMQIGGAAQERRCSHRGRRKGLSAEHHNSDHHNQHRTDDSHCRINPGEPKYDWQDRAAEEE